MSEYIKLDHMNDDEVMKELIEDMGNINATLKCLADRGYMLDVTVIEHSSITQAHPTPIISVSVFEQKL
jgi:hypothetical protein